VRALHLPGPIRIGERIRTADSWPNPKTSNGSTPACGRRRRKNRSLFPRPKVLVIQRVEVDYPGYDSPFFEHGGQVKMPIGAVFRDSTNSLDSANSRSSRSVAVGGLIRQDSAFRHRLRHRCGASLLGIRRAADLSAGGADFHHLSHNLLPVSSRQAVRSTRQSRTLTVFFRAVICSLVSPRLSGTRMLIFIESGMCLPLVRVSVSIMRGAPDAQVFFRASSW